MAIWYDIFILFMLFVAMLVGFSTGMARQVVSVGGLYFGLVVASYYYSPLTRFATRMLGEASDLSRDAGLFFVVFALVWFFINVGATIAFRTSPRWLPAALDRLVGMVLGLATGALAVIVLTILLIYATNVPWPENNGVRLFIGRGIESSSLRALINTALPAVGQTIEPWLPGSLPSFFNLRF